MFAGTVGFSYPTLVIVNDFVATSATFEVFDALSCYTPFSMLFNLLLSIIEFLSLDTVFSLTFYCSREKLSSDLLEELLLY